MLTNWMLLTDQQQRKNFKALQSARHPCVFFDVEMAAFWNRALPNSADAPIVQSVEKYFRVGAAQSTWKLLVPTDTKTAVYVSADRRKKRITLPALPTSQQSQPIAP